MRVIALFSAFDVANPGGVQESARIAWEGLRAEFDVTPVFIAADRPHRWLSASFDAWRARGRYDACLIWHTSLLRLVPFLRLDADCVKVLFLHGIEVWQRRNLSPCDVVLANTAHTLKLAGEFNPVLRSKTSHVVHLGLGTPINQSMPVTGPPVAVMISRLHPDERYKGHDEVLAAWPSVVQQVPDAQLWIVGDGDLRAELERIVQQRGLQNSVRFFGRVDEWEKQQLIASARCLLMPSTAEGFGLVYLEAMRLGRPCLTGMDGGREVVNAPEAGLSVTHRTPEEITSAVVRLLRADQDWRDRARSRYEQQFTASAFQQRLCAAVGEARR